MIRIYGASDDLVEVEGNVPGCDEYNGDEQFVLLSTGDVFRVHYTEDGVWKVERVRQGTRRSGCTYQLIPHGDGDDPEPYTETMQVTGPVEYVEAWNHYPPTLADVKEKIDRHLIEGDTFDPSGILTDSQVRDIWEMVSNVLRKKKS